MISSPQPNEATANSNSNARYSDRTRTIPPQPTPQLENSQHFEQHVERLFENGRAGKGSAQLRRRNSWQKLSLRTKATALALALGTIPVLAIGTTNYFLFSKQIRRDVIERQVSLNIALGDEVSRFMFERYEDIQVFANLAILNNPKGTAEIPLQQKQEQLDKFVETHGVYDSIAAYDLNGNLTVKSGNIASNNQLEQEYFQQVIKTGKPVISEPEKSKATGEIVVYFVAPIVDTTTNKMTGVVRSRLPMKFLEELVEREKTRLAEGVKDFDNNDYSLVDANGKVIIAREKEHVGIDASSKFPILPQWQATKKVTSAVVFDQIEKTKELVSYAPLEQLGGMPELNWSILEVQDTASAFAVQRRLLLNLGIGTLLTALLVGAIAAYLANRATRPIVAAADAVEKLGQGKLNTRIAVEGEDELAVLGSNINRMAIQIQTLLVAQEEASRQELATQEQIAHQQAENAQKQKLAKEQLQARALELLMEVEPISKGDLTIRASVTADEIGTIADSYNATIASLRKIVTQVQAATAQVAATTSSSEVSVQELSQEALRQTQEITHTLDRIQEMSNSIRAIAKSAQHAEVAVQQANQTVQAGDAAMNRTVEGIVALRETVAQTSNKVKQLGESSQKISKVVNLIGTFAAQTNLLALKASIEAARAGEEGRGFAVLAEEVRSLARQSQAATAEIESLVAAIQTETNEVVAAMQAGTLQVASGTLLVEETRQSLNQITTFSAEIGALVSAIASATVTQSQASEDCTRMMTDVAAIAQRTSTTTTVVSASFEELLEVAQELQANVDQFKVN